MANCLCLAGDAPTHVRQRQYSLSTAIPAEVHMERTVMINHIIRRRRRRLLTLALSGTLVLIPALLLSQPAFTADQHRESKWYVVGTWQQPQGLPQNSVKALLQTADGYLWVGTKGGLAR